MYQRDVSPHSNGSGHKTANQIKGEGMYTIRELKDVTYREIH